MAYRVYRAMRRNRELYVLCSSCSKRCVHYASNVPTLNSGTHDNRTRMVWHIVRTHLLHASVPRVPSKYAANRSLQAFVILGVLHTLATDAIAMHRFQVCL